MIFVIVSILLLGLLFDVRDLINVQWCRENYVRCVNCGGLVGYYYDGVVDLFKYAVRKQVNAFVGRRSICDNPDCINEKCPQYLLRAGVVEYNTRYGERTLTVANAVLNTTHMTLGVDNGASAASANLRCVDLTRRFMDRARLCVEDVGFEAPRHASYANDWC